MLQNIQRNLVLIYVGGFDSLRVGLLLVEQIGQEAYFGLGARSY